MTATVEERFVTNGGVKIRYLDNRPETPVGEAVFFSPGVMDRADDYLETFDVFGDRRLLVIDHRGRGGSDAPEDGYSAEEQASDVAAVLDDAGVGRFHLMTFSRGTTSGLLTALDRRDRVQTVSIGDYVPAEIGLEEALVDRMMGTSWRGSPAAERISRHSLARIAAQSRSRDLWDELAGLDVPVLAVIGEKGTVGDERQAMYRSRIPEIELVVIPGAAHDLFCPVRSAYPEAVLEFIGRRRPGT